MTGFTDAGPRPPSTVCVAEPASYDALPAWVRVRPRTVPGSVEAATVEPVSEQTARRSRLARSRPDDRVAGRATAGGHAPRSGRPVAASGRRTGEGDHLRRRRAACGAADRAAPQRVTVGVTVVGPEDLLRAADAARLRGDREALVVEVGHADRAVVGGVDHEAAGAVDLQLRGPAVVGVVGDGPEPLALGVEADVGEVLEAAVDRGDLVRGGAVAVEGEGDQVAGVLDRDEVQAGAVVRVGRRVVRRAGALVLEPVGGQVARPGRTRRPRGRGWRRRPGSGWSGSTRWSAVIVEPVADGS